MRRSIVISSRARRRPTREAHRGQAQGPVADEMHHVHGHALVAVAAQVVAHGSPGEIHARRRVEREAPHLRAELVGHRRRREAAIAHDLGGHALADLRLGPAIGPETPVGMRVHVDEARRDGEAGGGDRPPRRLALEVPDRGDGVAGDPQIGAHGRRPRPVDDLAARDLDVEHRVADVTRTPAPPSTAVHAASGARVDGASTC